MPETVAPNADASLFTAALAAPIARLYMNGFIVGQSVADVTLVVQTNGTPAAVLNMSFTSAKSLAVELDKVIKNFESLTGHTLLTMQDIQEKMNIQNSPGG